MARIRPTTRIPQACRGAGRAPSGPVGACRRAASTGSLHRSGGRPKIEPRDNECTEGASEGVMYVHLSWLASWQLSSPPPQGATHDLSVPCAKLPPGAECPAPSRPAYLLPARLGLLVSLVETHTRTLAPVLYRFEWLFTLCHAVVVCGGGRDERQGLLHLPRLPTAFREPPKTVGVPRFPTEIPTSRSVHPVLHPAFRLRSSSSSDCCGRLLACAPGCSQLARLAHARWFSPRVECPPPPPPQGAPQLIP